MPEVKHEVKTYKVDYKCDVCGRGWYRPTGTVYPTYPAQYIHKCSACGAEITVYGKKYPYTLTEKIEEEG